MNTAATSLQNHHGRLVETAYGNALDLDFVQYAEEVASGAFSAPDSLENAMSDFDEATELEARRRARALTRQTSPSPYLPHQGLPDGYMSDCAYAVPKQSRTVRHESYHTMSSNETNGYPGVLKRPNHLSYTTSSARESPAFDLSPSRRLVHERGRNQRTVPLGHNLSDSLTSLSSIGSSTAGAYRGLSGQIARNLDSLATRLAAAPPGTPASPVAASTPAKPARRLADEASVLSAVRAQMDMSLSQMAELESQVQAIPALSSRISSLKADKQQLAAELARAKSDLLARDAAFQRDAAFHREPAYYSNQHSAVADNFPRPFQTLQRQPPPVPPKRSHSAGPYKALSTTNLPGAVERETYSTSIARAFRYRPESVAKAVSSPSSPPKPPPRSDSYGRMQSPESVRSGSTLQRPTSAQSNPQPPPPEDPARREAPILRTPNGSIMNLAAFSSLRRNPSQSSLILPESIAAGSSRTSTLRPASSVSRSSSRDGYASDSELALGDARLYGRTRSDSVSSSGGYSLGGLGEPMERFTSLRRSRRILSQSAAAANNFLRDSAASETEDAYSNLRQRRASMSSLSGGGSRGPSSLGGSQLSIDGSIPGAFASEIRKWREEFGGAFASTNNLATPPESEMSHGQPRLTVERAREYLRKNVLVRSAATTTVTAASVSSVAVMAKMEPETKRVEASVGLRTGLCPNCEGKKRTSIAVNTNPLPPPKPLKECPDCPYLKMKLEEQEKSRPILMSKETETHGVCARLPSRQTNTELETYTIGTTADIPEPRPESASVAIGPDDRVVLNVSSQTAVPELCSRHSNTEDKVYKHAIAGNDVDNMYQLQWIQDAETGVDSLYFFSSIGVGTHNDPFNPGVPDSELAAAGAEVESVHLQPLESTQTVPLTNGVESISEPTSEARPAPTGPKAETVEVETETELDVDGLLLQLKILQNATDLPKKKAKRSLGQDKSVSTEELRQKSFGTNTPTRRLADGEANTEPVRIAEGGEAAEQRHKAVATDGAATRSVYSGTEQTELRDKGVGGPIVRTRDAGTMPTIPAALLPTTLASTPVLSSSTDSASAPVEQGDKECQVELPPSEEEILDWAGDYIEETLQSKEAERENPEGPAAIKAQEERREAVLGVTAEGSAPAPPEVPVDVPMEVEQESATSPSQPSEDTPSSLSSPTSPLSPPSEEMEEEEVIVKMEDVTEKEKVEEVKLETSGAKTEPQLPDPEPSSSSLSSPSSASTANADEANDETAEVPELPEPDYDEDEDAGEDDDEDDVAEKKEDTDLKEPITIPRPKPDIRRPRTTRAFQLSKAAAAKKLLTSQSSHQASLFGSRPLGSNASSAAFTRGSSGSSSVRLQRKAKGDSLSYITDRATKPNTVAKKKPSSPSSALQAKMALKSPDRKESAFPPVPLRSASSNRSETAKTNRISFGRLEEEALEAEEGADRLTPLPSELGRPWPPQPPVGYENLGSEEGGELGTGERCSSSLVGAVEPLPPSQHREEWWSSSASSSEAEEGSWEPEGESGRAMSTSTSTVAGEEEWAVSEPLREALDVLGQSVAGSLPPPDSEKLTWATQYASHEWLKCGARKSTNPHHVEAFLDLLETHSKALLAHVVNFTDHNENTALHYAVSHGNFDVVSLLLDAKVCNLNRANRAGYTPVMLAALCPIPDDTAAMVIQRLFNMGDVNVKASQHGQTALMLAVSHGKEATTRLLLEAGAGVNIQDEDGSTALMCAAEHGHKHIVKLLLAQSDVDASLADGDGATALAIAVDNGHRDIGLLLYAHLNYRGQAHSSSPHTLAAS